MTVADIPAVGHLFNRIFRHRDEPAGPELVAYMKRLLFDNPRYAPEHGSNVHVGADGKIDSAMLSVPMPFVMGERAFTARLLCAFMADPACGAAGAGRLTLAMRRRLQEFAFSDNAGAVSADHWVAGGGHILPAASLEWMKILRPLSGLLSSRTTHLGSFGRVLMGLVRPFDVLLRRIKRDFVTAPVAGLTDRAASFDDFAALIPEMTRRFALRPAWDEDDYRWLHQRLTENAKAGVLSCRLVLERDTAIGAVLYYDERGVTARILNVLWREGRQHDVVAQIVSHFDRAGYALIRGVAQPALLPAVMRQKNLLFRHRGYFSFVSRHDDIVAAMQTDNAYLGGLASEGWSRLVDDF